MSFRPFFPWPILVAVVAVLAITTAVIIFKNPVKKKTKIFATIRMMLIYLLVLIIGLRPVRIQDEYEFSTKNLDVVIVVDTTISMWAEDYNGTNWRIRGAQKDCEYIIDELAGANFSLVTFSNQARVISPFTQEFDYVKSQIKTLVCPNADEAVGSNMFLPYHDMESLIRSSSKKEGRKTIVFFLSDGENSNGEKTESFKALAENIDGGAVIGYGTANGARMNANGKGYIIDPSTGSMAESKMDEENLKNIASEMNISYINANRGNDGIKGHMSLIKELGKTVVDKAKGVEVYEDLYFYLAIPLALLILYELVHFIRTRRL